MASATVAMRPVTPVAQRFGGSPRPVIRVRPFTATDARVLRRWAAAPECFLHVEDLLASAGVPGTTTSVAVDTDGRVVAVLQCAPEGDVRAGMRSLALLVHPGRRGAGFGRASLLAALREPCCASSALLAVVDRENTASLRCFEACGFAAVGDAAPGRYAELVCRVPAAAAA